MLGLEGKDFLSSQILVLFLPWAVCGGNVNGGKVCLKSPDARCNHKIKGAYVKKNTLYVRAAKGSQLTTVFGSYHLSTSNL